MKYLYDKLKKYSESGYYGFHMPGHKRNPALTGAELPYKIDITEIPGFDDLHHAEGILKEAQERAARLFGAEETHYLVNGSTVGLLSAVLGSTQRGDRILMARNCHKSVYNAVCLNELEPVYIYPARCEDTGMNGPISPEDVAKALGENPDIRAVVITSPTYDGVVSDISCIAETAHERGIPLILDEAHGAHFGFHPYFPLNGNALGADIVIHSLHKTLPSLTQTALLHINGDLADRGRVRRYLHILQSSSPSYVLMASLDECVRTLDGRGPEIFERYVSVLDHTRQALSGMSHLRLLETAMYDRSKILVSCAGLYERDEYEKDRRETKNYTGKQLYQELNEKYLLQMEMASLSYIIAMTSPADTESAMRRLENALFEIDGKLAKNGMNDGENASPNSEKTEGFAGNEMIYTPAEAERLVYRKKQETMCVPLQECGGRIALEYAYVYPPGIPLIVPGERVSEEVTGQIAEYERSGFEIEGTGRKGWIEVQKNG